jgi:Na+/H+-dicarboxylate symporter/ABC-type amino acid transport substrate-binding protein
MTSHVSAGRKRMSLSAKITLGLAGGVVTGLFLGERAAFLEWPAKAFVQLLQVTVMPFLVTSLISGIASGSSGQAGRLFARAGVIVLALWAISLALVFLVPLALPASMGGAFYSTATVSSQERIDWIELYIPANPFRSLSNNLVPAVVVFSVLLGIALSGLRDKDRVLGPLRLIGDTLGRAGSMLVALTPIGIFAIAGHAAGTLRLEEFGRLQAYLLVTIGLHALFTLWILPGLTSALTGIPYRRILTLIWDPLITAFATANLFIVLPLIQERSKQLLAEQHRGDRESGEAVDVLVSTSFAFPSGAKLLSISFIPFAAWFIGAPLAASQFPSLATAGILSNFGSLYVAIPFLLDLVRLPADLFNLFVISSVVTARFGSAAAVMSTYVFAVLGAFLMTGRRNIDKRRVLTFASVTVVSAAAVLFGSRLLLVAAMTGPERTETMFDRLHPSGAWGKLATLETGGEGGGAQSTAPIRGRRLDDIVSRGTLRVCVSPDAMPWCYVNGRDELVGFDVDVAHALAVQLKTRLALVPVERLAFPSALVSGACDLGTRRITPSQASSIVFSRPMAFEKWAFLTLDHERNVYAGLDSLRQLRAPRITVFREPEWIDMLQARLPNAEVIPIDSLLEYIKAPAGRFDATFTGYDRALAYSVAYPQFAAVVPTPDFGSIPIAISVPAGEEPLLALANAFIEVGAAEGVFQEKLDYWIKGEGAQLERERRWSIGRNILGWWR